MSKSTFPEIDNFDTEVMSCLTKQMIPDWKQYGGNHLIFAEESLTKFQQRTQPFGVHPTRERDSFPDELAGRTQRQSRVWRIWVEEDLVAKRYPVLNYVRTGYAQYRIGDYSFEYPQGYFLFIPPGVIHPAGERAHAKKPYHGKHCEIWHFTPVGNGRHIVLSICYSRENKHKSSGQFYIVGDDHTNQLFRIFSQELISNSAHCREIAYSAFASFLYSFLREIEEGRFYNRGVDNLPDSADLGESPIEMACQYIERNLNHPLTIDIVARAVFMSRSGFTRQFREEIGKTFNEYLTDRRMEQAKYWLSQGYSSVKIVRHLVGLKHSQFYRLFRRYFGVTPAEFRNANRRKKNN